MTFTQVLKGFIVGLTILVGSIQAETIRIVVPFAPGGAADQAARVLERALTTHTQNTYVIEYRVGAGGAIGANYVAKSRGSDTILLIHSLALVVNSLQPDAAYSLVEFEPIATLGTVQLALITNPKSAVNTMPKLLATRDTVFFGSSGNGTATHIAGELFGTNTSVNMIHVPYKGEAAALVDIIGNNITALFTGVSVARDQPVSVLAVTGTRRSREFPQVPTLQEQGVRGFETSPNWLVLLANTTADQRTLAVIRAALSRALAEDPELFARVGVDTDRQQLYNTQQFVNSERQRVQKILSRIQPK
jgi:tripartite-type tricarboxylate transporter receptor subunit TctC